MSKKRVHQYRKDPFKTTSGQFISSDNHQYDARSGMHSYSSMKWGEIPNGSYQVGGFKNTNNVPRYTLEPRQDIGSRSSLQIHPKSQNYWKNATGFDTKGCISIDRSGFNQVRPGDEIKVTVGKPDFNNKSHVWNSIVNHNQIFESVDYDPNDYFDNAPKGSGGDCMIM